VRAPGAANERRRSEAVEAAIRRGDLGPVLDKVLGGERLGLEDGARLYETADLPGLGYLANLVREAWWGDRASFVRNLHLNPTNVCRFTCAFCAFGVRNDSASAYEMDLAAVRDRLAPFRDACLAEVHILSEARSGRRIAPEEALLLAVGADFHDLAAAARDARARRHPGRDVTYIVNTNINYTNVCVTRCRFCSFYRLPGHDEGYVLDPAEVVRRALDARARGATQVLLQGGHHPRLGIEHFEDLIRAVRERTGLHLHALSAPEVHHLARIRRRPVGDVLRRLRAAGLDTLPGGGAEVLADEVRAAESPRKCTADEWIEVHRVAHGLGIRSSATMMFGLEEDRWRHRVDHLARLRALQDETAGFTAFIAWTYQPRGNLARPGERSAMTYLRLVALARLFLDNVGTIQASPLTQPPGVVQLALDGGADDFGNVLLEEHVVAAAGVELRVTEALARRTIAEAGYRPVRRDTYYRPQGEAA